MNNIKMLYFDKIGLCEGIDVNKTWNQKSVIFATIGIFYKEDLSFSCMHAIDAMIY